MTSGYAACFVLRKAERRMDLIRDGAIVGAVSCVAAVAILLLQRSDGAVWPMTLFWSAFNGLATGMLVLGLLPPLESALNSVTPFRLIELADLNSPTLKKLFTVAPGTYNHSLMVANLAEAACREIGANPMIARVGAYYHDIGKMENPDYFVENQTDHNKHDDINPRLSVTVIKSHVKLGIEMGESLNLPQEVIDIIAEHHGNDVITYFYYKALKMEEQENKKQELSEEVYSYPGNPPRSKESAVVMLADVTEAASRTLKKPTQPSLEKLIKELFAKKIEHEQLINADLTFRDLEMIKDAFVRVLAGHYHSRIEYPKEEKEKSEKDKEQQSEQG
jgi:putative nucleotidyltransferase with HDIG domain